MKKWRRFRRLAIAASLLAVCLFTFASNSLLYFSHERFPALAWLQRNHRNEFRFPLEIVAHRGIPYDSTNPTASPGSTVGNTRASIRRATQSNHVDWIEIDVRRTADGTLVLFHDARLEKKTNLSGKVESTNWADLREAKLWVEDENDKSIPLLKTVLADFQSTDVKWILDIKLDKDSDDAIQDAKIIKDDVIALLQELQISNKQIIIFGDHVVLEAFHRSGFRQGYTALYKTHKHLLLSHTDVLDRCRRHHCDLLVVPIVFVTPSLIESAYADGISVWSYDSNDPRDLRYCRECGVQGLIVDKPGNASFES